MNAFFGFLIFDFELLYKNMFVFWVKWGVACVFLKIEREGRFERGFCLCEVILGVFCIRLG